MDDIAREHDECQRWARVNAANNTESNGEPRMLSSGRDRSYPRRVILDVVRRISQRFERIPHTPREDASLLV